MKTYALYLLMLCSFFVGCQKDIGTNETDLSTKETKAKLYLPEELFVVMKGRGMDTSTYTEHYKFTYENDEGDLKSIISTNNFGYKSYRFLTYKNHQLDTFTGYSDNSDFKTTNVFSYANGKAQFNTQWYISLKDSTQKLEGESDTYNWNNEKLLSIFNNGKGTLVFSYAQDTLKSLDAETGSGFAFDFGDRIFTYTDKNYWAKNIKNKDILTNYLPLMGPYEFDVSKIDVTIELFNPPNTPAKQLYQYNNKYNADCYPIEINELYTGIRNDGRPIWRSSKITIKYKE